MSGSSSKNTNTNINDNDSTASKYHALVIDSGAIIKQTSLSNADGSLLTSARSYYTVPAVLSEIRDPKSRAHLEEFRLRLRGLGGGDDGDGDELHTRVPSRAAVRAVSEFARKTGDYPQLSGVDLQVLALTYDLEKEAADLHGGGMDHVRREPKRVLGVSVRALNGDGKKVASPTPAPSATGAPLATGDAEIQADFFRGDADGIIDAAHVDIEYDEDGDDRAIGDDAADGSAGADEEREDSSVDANAAPPKPKSWAVLVNPQKASTAPPVNYSLATSSPGAALGNDERRENQTEEKPVILGADLNESGPAAAVGGQFDDASEESGGDDDDFSEGSDDDGELDAINMANAASDDEMSDEECDVFVLEPHEAFYFKKLKEKKAEEELVQSMKQQTISSQARGEAIETDFPSLASAAAVPYDGSDEEAEETTGESNVASQQEWEQDEVERKKRALQPMVNGRIVKSDRKAYNSFRKYKNVVSADGAALAMKRLEEEQSKSNEEDETSPPGATAESSDNDGTVKEVVSDGTNNANDGEYKSRILGATGASSSSDADFASEMTAADDDGEGWVTSTRDIRTMKATGTLHPSTRGGRADGRRYPPRKEVGPPTSQRAACATTDFAMQNVILQMGLELLTVDGVRVRRLKTWVTRCGACFTVYGNDDTSKTGRLFCDRCGSDALQRIAASVDRNTGRLKLHMRKHYQYNTRGTKFSLPKAGKGNKYEGDLLLAEDQLMYGAWNQKVRKGKSKSSGQSIFGSGLAADLGCHSDLTKRDDIKVGFGRRNPNSTKFGRERRGKKKKGAKDKACGLKRY